MTGTICIRGLAIECIVGILPDERTTPQTIYVDAEMDRDFAPSAASEDVSDTVDYVAIAEALTTLAKEGEFQLIETLAERSAEMLLNRFDATRVVVEIQKPQAVPAALHAAVRVERRS